MRRYKQSGSNPDWPQIIEDTWKYGEPVPEWLSDRAHVTIISGDGIKNIEIRENSTGGFEVVDSGKIGSLVSLRQKDWFVIFDGKRISSISPEQLLFLYKKEEKK